MFDFIIKVLYDMSFLKNDAQLYFEQEKQFLCVGYKKVIVMDNKAIVIFKMYKRNVEVDLEIPLDITVNDLVNALNTAYELGIDTSDMKNCYLKTENPIALLKGNRILSDYGIRNGTVINFTE